MEFLCSPGAAGGGRSPSRAPRASASKCVLRGDGLHTALARQTASFVIEARDARGEPLTAGGDPFKVDIRGASIVSCKVFDNEDGTYRVDFKPSTSGEYQLAVSVAGVLLADCPRPIRVLTPKPTTSHCVLRGDALSRARARETAQFEVQFMDALGMAHGPSVHQHAAHTQARTHGTARTLSARHHRHARHHADRAHHAHHRSRAHHAHHTHTMHTICTPRTPYTHHAHHTRTP